MPSFTFVSTANVVLRGASPVFVDIDPLTFNSDPDAVAAALTGRTRAVYAVEESIRLAPNLHKEEPFWSSSFA
jgi:dTDP-4-amino-4,6-dideoxygalactose transaminase